MVAGWIKKATGHLRLFNHDCTWMERAAILLPGWREYALTTELQVDWLNAFHSRAMTIQMSG
jgi:hypothetical protein